MKILVTGSSGFIGYHLVKKLLTLGHQVIGIDNHNDYYSVDLKEHRADSLSHHNYTFYLQDINKISIKEDNIDIAIHLAAQAGVRLPKNKEHLYEHSNKKGFESFCKFCHTKGINRIIYASSSSVYSDLETKKFCENKTVLKPKSKYGISKLENEKFATYFSKISGIQFVGLRFFSVYGPLGRPDMAYYKFTEAIKNGNEVLLNNGGVMSRDMTFIDDVIGGILGAIKFIFKDHKGSYHEIFNIGNNYPVLTLDLLSTIETKLNKTAFTRSIKTKNEALITHANITKASNLLGYVPKINLQEGIEIFLEWHNHYENLQKT